MSGIDPTIPVRCLDPVQLDVRAQAQICRESTLVLAEHGTVGYTALNGHDGLVLLSIARRSNVKDMQIFLYITHIDTYYMAYEDKDVNFEGMLRFCLARAANNFGITTQSKV